MTKPRLTFLLLFTLLLAARMCHVGILWAEEDLPMAAAAQMRDGKVLYRDAWFDKPPLLPALYALWGVGTGWPLRLAGALYGLLACWLAYRLARELWSEREGVWAACLLGFFLVFDIPSSVTPVATDLAMLAPHLAAIWLAWKRRAFWSGAMAGVAFLVSPKGLFVLAACALWNPLGIPLLAAGFAAVSAAGAAWLWSCGALGPFYEQVWVWGRYYAGDTFVAEPVRNGVVRTLNWAGFHAALVAAGAWFLARGRREPGKPSLAVWAGWAALSLAGVTLGWRFFPRYYMQLLPVAVIAAARGFTMLNRRCAAAVAILLLIPAARFGPRYFLLARDLAAGRESDWADTAMDRDSRAASALALKLASPGATLFVWGFRPDVYVYTRLPAASLFLDSQALTGVPADRHLTQSKPVETESARRNREQLARLRPTLVLDGLSLYNPGLAIGRYPELRTWLANYREAGRTGQTVVYELIGGTERPASPGGR